jgi:hypothetical protein
MHRDMQANRTNNLESQFQARGGALHIRH